MYRIHTRAVLVFGVCLGLLFGVPEFVLAGPEDKLSEFDFLLLGLSVRPEPEVQVVPINTPTGVQIAIGFADSSADASGLLSLLPPGLEVAAELVGPGLDTPVALRGPPGQLLPIPPLLTRGLFLVRDIRLEKDGTTLIRGTPDTATIEVVDQILITQVITRPLTLEEIRQKGILFGDDDFTGFNFTIALNLDSRLVSLDFPVVFDSNNIPVPIPNAPDVRLKGLNLPGLGGAGIVPMMLDVGLPEGTDIINLPELGGVSVPGLLVIPGEVGFLNQFFSAILLVSNGAPGGSGLVVTDLEATIELPAGDDQVPDTADDPLEIAETAAGQAFTLPILGLGPDGESATGDDTNRFASSEQGQAEFLVEGRREGFHTLSFDIEGVLEGLPIGPVPISGSAKGGVLVRNPFFNMTFTAPSTVRIGEEFSLFITVSNISQAVANLVTVTLNQASLAGATLLGDPAQQIDTLLPGDSEAMEYRFRSNQTGQVTASYLRFDGTESTGDLLFTLGVGPRGAPLSPDTIVLPSTVEVLPDAVLMAALRVLGQAWSIATAPAGTIPEGVTSVSKTDVYDRANEIAEAGFRVQIGEPLARALQGLLFDWLSTDARGFEEILRETNAGVEFLNAIGESIASPGTIEDLQRELSRDFAARPSHILLGVGSGNGSAPVTWDISDGVGRALRVDSSSDLLNAGFLPFAETKPLDPGRGLAVLTSLGSTFYEMRWTATGAGVLDLAVSLPLAEGTSFYLFSGVSVDSGNQGKVEIDLLGTVPTLTLSIDRDGDAVFEESVESAPVEIIQSSGPELLAATVVGPETLSGADPWGRVVALLFDKEVRAEEAERASNYRVADNEVLSTIRQLSGRLVFVFLRDPVGDLVPRQATVTGLFDPSGQPMIPFTVSLPITSRLEDPGAIVTGRVLEADGTPLGGAQIFYLNSSRGVGLFAISAKEVEPDGSYGFDYVRQSPDGPFAMRAIDPDTGSSQELTTSVRTNGEHIVVDLVLLGRGGVTGTVRDLVGEPVPGAQVLVTSQVDPASFALAETNGEGRYEAPDIVVGAVAVKAVSGTSFGVAAGNIQRAGTFTVVDVTVNLNAGRVIGGVFELDPELGAPTPVSMIEVHYLIPNPDGPGELVAASGETAGDGTFVFEDVPSGAFRILAIDRVIGRQESRPGTLVAGGVVEDFDLFFSVDEFGAVRGTVLTASDGFAVGALVTVAGRQVLTGPDGSFLVPNVPVGSHTVSVRHASTTRQVSTGVTINAPGDVVDVSLTLPGAGTVVVTVLDVNGDPLVGQTVFRLAGSPCAGIPQVTDGSGVAVFEEVQVPGAAFKAIANDDVAEGSARIQREGDNVAVTLRLSGFGTVTGTVLDDQGAPALGATVILGARRLDLGLCTFLRDGRAAAVQTGPDGKFVFDRIPVGAVSVSASTVFFPIPATGRDSLLFDGDTRDFTLNLSSSIAGELSGTVFLPDGVTPAGVGVSVTASSSSFPDVTVTTDVDGHYAFAKIFPAGSYVLNASDVVTGSVARLNVSLLADQDLSADLRLLGRGSVEVTVLDGAGGPVDEAFVELRGSEFPFSEAAGAITLDDSGVIRFDNITEGDFTVTASDSLGRGGRANGMLGADGVAAEITVSLTVTGTVRGTVVNSDGSEPIPNAEVRLRQGTTGRLLGSTTSSSAPDSLGRFEFSFVPAGTVLGTATDPITGRIGEASGKIETEDDMIDLEIRMLGLGSIAGIVTRNGDPTGGATVNLTSSTGLSSSVANLKATATTGSEGEFAFDGVPVGTFTLKANVPGLLLTGTASGAITTDGEEVTGIDIALQPSGSILGSVRRADATTLVPGASLILKAPRSFLRSESDVSGRFRFDFVPIGDFELTAEETGSADAGIVEGTLGEGEELEVEVVFNGTGTVEGLAFDSDSVTLLTSGTIRLTTPAPFARSLTTTVTPEGTYRFLRVPVGTFNLFLSVSGLPLKGTAMAEITVDGETVTKNIQLADSGTVLGRVVKPDGSTSAANVVVSLSGSGFVFNDLTGTEGDFRIEGVPLGDFNFRAEDPATASGVVAFGSISGNEEEIDLGTLQLDDSPIAVAEISPDGTVPAPPDTAIVIRFTDPVDPPSLSGRVAVSSDGVNISIDQMISLDRLELTLTARTSLPPSSVIDVFLGEGIEDALGRSLGTDFLATFSTSGAVVTGTLVLGVTPVEGADVTLTAGTISDSTSTDPAGHYRFEDVPVGNVTVQAFDSVSGLAASAVLNIGPADSVHTADLSLAFAGNITGQVFQFDGTAAGPGLEVLILHSTTPVALATTDAAGGYLASNVPLGDFAANVTNPANGDRGQESGTLAAVETVTADVTLLGVGAVRLFLRNGADELIPDAEASIQLNRFGTSILLENPSSEPDGSLLFPFVVAGSIRIEASDPATDLVTTVSGNAVAGEEVTVDIVLQAAGSIAGQVLAPDGVTLVEGARVSLFREAGSSFRGETVTDADGKFGFAELPVAQGPYRVDVSVDGRLRARRRGIEVPADGEVTIELQLVGVGTVRGALIAPGPLSSFARVTLTSLSPDIGGFFSDADVSDGNYEITGVPVGAVTLSAVDGGNGFLGEADGEVSADGEEVTIDIELVDNALNLRFGKSLRDGNQVSYFVQKGGSLSNGTDGIFNASDRGGLHLDVTVDSILTRFEGADIGSQEEEEREIVTASQDIGGITVQRKVFVPKDGYFARYLEIFENLSPDPISFSASVVSNLNNVNGAPRIISTSNGDALIDPEDFWLITDDNSPLDPFEGLSSPSIAWVTTEEGASISPVVNFEGSVGTTDGRLTARYDVTLPPGERTVLMHFVSQQLSPPAAEEAAHRLSGLGSEAMAGLAPDEIAAIANFAVPVDGTSALAPLPELDGVVTGKLFAHDGVNTVGFPAQSQVRVEFQSDFILYRRIRDEFNDAAGRFSFETDFGVSTTVIIPRTGFTLTAAPTRAGQTSAIATATANFVGGSNFSRSPDATATASSFQSSRPPQNAVDGKTSSSWRPATADSDPTFELELPIPLPIDTIRLIPASGAQMLDAQIDLLGGSDEVLDSFVEPFPGPAEELLISLPAPVEGVHRIFIRFTGDRIRLAELEVLGTTTTDIGSTLRDLVFEGTSAISGTVRRDNGEGAPSSVTIIVGGVRNTRSTDGEGSYFFAPIPGSVGSVRVDAVATDNRLLAVAGRVFELFPDTTANGDISYAETTEVTGRVLSATSTLLSGRTVNIIPGVGGSGLSRTTGADGVFRFEEIPSGDYLLQTQDFSTGRIVRVPITVATPPTPVVQDLVIPAFGTVSLTALFETAPGDPITPAGRAQVRIMDSLDSDFRFVGSTPSSGQVGQLVINNVATGPFVVRVFNPTNLSLFGEAGSTVDFEGQTVPLTVTIPALGRVTGTILFADNTAAPFARVEISGTGITSRSTTASSLGVYTFTSVEALLPFTVLAKHPDRSLITAQAVGEVPGQGATAEVDVTLPKIGTVEVTVTQDGVGPLFGVDIRLQDSSSPTFFFRGRTDVDGKATVTLVPEGTFTVRAEGVAEGRFTTIGEATGEVVNDSELVEVSIVRPEPASVEGTVVAADGETPIPRARVELRSADGLTFFGSILADDFGFFRFDNAFQAGEDVLLRAIFPADASKVGEEPATASDPGELVTVTVEIPVSVVKGRVLEWDGTTPVAAASVELLEDDFGVISTTANDSGEFAVLDSPTGGFELFAEDSFGLAVFVRTELPIGEPVLVQDLILPRFGAIEGTVTDTFGIPLASDAVVLRSANLRGWRQANPDASGFFRFERVALGSFGLTYEEPTGIPIENESGEEEISAPGSVTGRLATLGEIVTADILVPDLGTLFGQVLDGGGLPNTTSLTTLEGRGLETPFGFFGFEISNSSSDGTYEQEGIPAGDITVNAVDGDAAGVATATVVAGADNEINVTLSTATALPVTIDPSPGLSVGFEEFWFDGSINGDSGEGSFELSELRVNDKRFRGLATATAELSGTQVVFGPIQTSGVDYTRKVLVADDSRFVRYLEILENPHPFDVEVTINVSGNETFVDSTSSGDSQLDPTDRYFASDVFGEVSVAVIFAGAGVVRIPDAARGRFDYELEWRRLEVPAGARVILMHFAVQAEDLAAAESQADILMNLTDPAAFSDLTAEERSQVVNFLVP